MNRQATRPLYRIGLLAGFGALFALGSVAPPVAAQETDDRWLAWMGCWVPVRSSDSPTEVSGAMVCFQPVSGDVGVEMISIEDGEVAARQTLRADSERHEASLEGCTGWESGSFSERPGRVFLRAEYDCDGGVNRSSTGLLAMTSAERWIDVRSVAANGEGSAWVTRYRLATQSAADRAGFGDIAADRGMAVRSARVAAAGRPSIDDVIEASGNVDPDVVQAWLIERELPLSIDSESLVAMADAGVAEETIDVAIAVSFPDRFRVGRDAEQYAGAYPQTYAYGRGGYFDPFYGSMFGFYYSPFGYSPYGYGYGYGGFGRYYGRPIITVDRDSGGRVINGQGYSRGSGSRSGSSGVRAPSSRGSSGAVRGSSGSSGGRSTGRTARRRGGGGL